jgi:hypothetical protein
MAASGESGEGASGDVHGTSVHGSRHRYNKAVLILRMRHALTPVNASESVSAFLDRLCLTMRPMLRAGREYQASSLGLNVDDISWSIGEFLRRVGGRDERATVEAAGFISAEIFVVDHGLLIVGLSNGSARRMYNPRLGGLVTANGEYPEQIHLDVSVLVSTTCAHADLILDSVSEIAKSTINVNLDDRYLESIAFRSIRERAVTEKLPFDAAAILAAHTLSDREARSLALSIKSSRGALAKDTARLLKTPEIPGILENLVSTGVARREIVVICRFSQKQVARVPDRYKLAKLAGEGLRCACGKRIDHESTEDLFTITELGASLLDKSRWLSVLFREKLIELGVHREDILLECRLDGDEIDCIASIGGKLVVAELKDKEFSIGNSYSFSAKVSAIQPDYAIILSTEKIANDVKDRFSDRKWHVQRRHSETPLSIHHIEGDFSAGLDRVVSDIYLPRAFMILDNALQSGIAEPSSVLEAALRNFATQP